MIQKISGRNSSFMGDGALFYKKRERANIFKNSTRFSGNFDIKLAVCVIYVKRFFQKFPQFIGCIFAKFYL